jgi:hypothetical protein
MEFVATIIVIILILLGFGGMVNDAREHGIFYLVLEIVGVIILAALGL